MSRSGSDSGDALAVGHSSVGSYARHLVDILGAKGIVVLAVFPLVMLVSPGDIHPIMPAGIVTGAFGYALTVDTEPASEELDPETSIEMLKDDALVERVDVVGLVFLVLSVGYVGLAALGVEVSWVLTLVAALAILGGVSADYLVVPDEEGGNGKTPDIDVVGFAAGEVLLLYSVIAATGWSEFAGSSTFGILSAFVYAGTVAAFAGHTASTREVVVSRTDDEIHDLHIEILNHIEGSEDETTRERVAEEMRRAADCVDGFEIPTVVEDGGGAVPVALSTRRPDAMHVLVDREDVLDSAEEEGFTGYVTHAGDLALFRNGSLSKLYRDGGYVYDEEGFVSDNPTSDASFHSLDYATLNSLDSITPREEEEEDADTDDRLDAIDATIGGADDGDGSDETEGEDGELGNLRVGGDEIDVDEMFERAEEVMDELE